MNIRKILMLNLIIIFAFIVITPTVIAKTSGKVNNSTIRLRSEPNTDSKIVTILYTGDDVTVYKEVNGWYKLKTLDGKEGYMKKEYINVSGKVDSETTKTEKPKTKKPETEKAETKKPETNPEKENTKTEAKDNNKITEITVNEDSDMKTYPLMYANKVKVLKKGEKVNKLDEKGNWVNISFKDSSGWILKSVLNNN